ncbi:hypothetical protein ACFLY6_00775 [Candidatus Dependentiae bacterium]
MKTKNTQMFWTIITLILSMHTTYPILAKKIEKPENRTKAGLKEELGTEIKSTLDQCVELNAHLAKLQLEISQIQKRLLSKGEELMDNGESFKNKDRKSLARAIENTSQACQKIAILDSNLAKSPLKGVMRQIERDACLGSNSLKAATA